MGEWVAGWVSGWVTYWVGEFMSCEWVQESQCFFNVLSRSIFNISVFVFATVCSKNCKAQTCEQYSGSCACEVGHFGADCAKSMYS